MIRTIFRILYQGINGNQASIKPNTCNYLLILIYFENNSLFVLDLQGPLMQFLT